MGTPPPSTVQAPVAEHDGDRPKLADRIASATAVASLLSLVAAGIKGFFPEISLPDASVSLILGVVALVIVGLVAQGRVRSPIPGPLPFPETFWRLLLKQVQTPIGTRAGVGNRVKIIVAHDPSALADARQIKNQNQDPTLDIQTTEIDVSQQHPFPIFLRDLKSADAVFFFWTNKTRENPHIREALNLWAHVEKEIPVLIVNTIPDKPYNLKFNYVTPSRATDGLPLLLQRSKERARLWVDLAGEYRRWWVGTVVLFLVSLLTLGWLLHRANGRLLDSDRRDYIDKGNFSALAGELLKARRTLETPEQQTDGGTLVTPLNEMADFLTKDIVKDSGIPDTSDTRITIYRAMNFKNGNRLVQVAASRALVQYKFAVDCTSIVGCSVVKKAFILWRSNCALGSPSAWDLDGKQIGVCTGNLSILFSNPTDNVQYGYFKQLSVDPSVNHKGLLCFSPEIPSSGKMIADTAVCLDTALDADFMDKPWVRAKLQVLALAANSIPTKSLITAQESQRLESEPDVQ